MAEAELYLNVLAERLKQAGLHVKAVLACGAAGDEILEEVHRRAANLIVMASHGRSGLTRWLYGSVAEDVLRRSGVPVVLAPSGAAGTWSDNRPLRILVALDGSEFSEAVLEPISALATDARAELVLVRVVAWPPIVADRHEAPPELLDAEGQLAAASEYLQECGRHLASSRAAPRQRVDLGWPPARLAQLADEENADLIAMATHGRTGLARVVLGSVASGTLHRSRVPVLLIRPASLAAPSKSGSYEGTGETARV
jgi:nucleotide-binding universal stress UspA family protein